MDDLLDIIYSVTIFLPNPVEPPRLGVPVAHERISMALNNYGQPVGQRVYTPLPLVRSRITPDLVAAMDGALAAVGLTVSYRDVVKVDASALAQAAHPPAPAPEPTLPPSPAAPVPPQEPTPVPNGPVLPSEGA